MVNHIWYCILIDIPDYHNSYNYNKTKEFAMRKCSEFIDKCFEIDVCIIVCIIDGALWDYNKVTFKNKGDKNG